MLKNCITCKTEVSDFKGHVKNVWHTYNLRRETVGLLPVTLEIFKAKQAELIAVEEPQKEYRCCSKSYKSQKTYEDHLKSKKHTGSLQETKDEEKDNMEYEDEEEEEEYEDEEEKDDSDDEVPLTINDCLLCNNSSKDLESNILHMKQMHEFRFPYPEYLRNIRGMMEYLTNIVGTYYVCLKCDKQFYNRLSVRNHMLDSNHGHINGHLVDNLDVLHEFYDTIPQPLSSLDSNLVEVKLPNGKLIGNRMEFKYFKQNLNGLSNTSHLAITSGMDKAKMSVLSLGRAEKLAKPGLLTHQEKKLKSKEARYRQFRLSRYSNFQAHYRHQILM